MDHDVAHSIVPNAWSVHFLRAQADQKRGGPAHQIGPFPPPFFRGRHACDNLLLDHHKWLSVHVRPFSPVRHRLLHARLWVSVRDDQHWFHRCIAFRPQNDSNLRNTGTEHRICSRNSRIRLDTLRSKLLWNQTQPLRSCPSIIFCWSRRRIHPFPAIGSSTLWSSQRGRWSRVWRSVNLVPNRQHGWDFPFGTSILRLPQRSTIPSFVCGRDRADSPLFRCSRNLRVPNRPASFSTPPQKSCRSQSANVKSRE